jgi:hypothetical protein
MSWQQQVLLIPRSLMLTQVRRSLTARQLISPEGLFAQIRQDMDALDKKGKLGQVQQRTLQ